jgi:hypothetical protein
MQKYLTTVVIASLTLIPITNIQAASIIAGKPCSKLNQKVISGNYQFTCIKSGKKYIWSKSNIDKSQASPASPSSEANALPTLSISNLYENRKYITQIAWSNLVSKYNSSQAKAPQIEVYRGPNTKNYNVDLQNLFTTVVRTVGNFPVPKAVRVIYYSAADYQWGLDKSLELMGAEENNRLISIHGGPLVKCNPGSDCSDGDAFVTKDNIAYLAIGHASAPSTSMAQDYANGMTEAVEFYHSLQQNFYALNNSFMPMTGQLRASNEPPFWLNIAGEGTAQNMYQIPSGKIDVYLENVRGDLRWAAQEYPNFDLQTISEYLSIKNLNAYWSNYSCCIENGRPGKMANMVGFPLMNILIALKGSEVLLAFHEGMASGKTFDEVFSKLFGVSYSSAEPIFDQVIYDQFKNGL